MQKLIGKTCLVTGAARGIGEAIARAFHREGGHLIITDIEESAGQDLAEELGGQFFRLDVSEEADWDDLARNVPQLDILVNNAGITGF